MATASSTWWGRSARARTSPTSGRRSRTEHARRGGRDIGIGIIAACEAFTLGVAAGIDSHRLFEVLRTSTSRSWVMESLVQDVVLTNRMSEEPAAKFALKLMHKDLRLAVATASVLKVPLAAGNLAEQMFAIAEGQGWGNQDHMAVIKLYANYVGIDRW